MVNFDMSDNGRMILIGACGAAGVAGVVGLENALDDAATAAAAVAVAAAAATAGDEGDEREDAVVDETAGACGLELVEGAGRAAEGPGVGRGTCGENLG